MLLFTGYFFLGLLIGTTTGLTSSPIANVVVTSVFAFVGGAITVGLDKGKLKRELLGGIVCSFSIACLFGIFLGIYVKENRLLTSLERQKKMREYSSTQDFSPYLKKLSKDHLKMIHAKYLAENGCDEAYGELRKLVLKSEDKE